MINLFYRVKKDESFFIGQHFVGKVYICDINEVIKTNLEFFSLKQVLKKSN